jgi:protein-disulfide isomerase
MRLTPIFLLLIISCSKSAPTPGIQYNIVEAPKDANVVAVIGSKKVTKRELYKNIEVELFELEEKIFKLKMDRMKILMLEKFMKEHPGKKGLTNDQFLEKYITKDIKISEAEFNGFVKKRGIPETHLSDDIRARIEKFLEQEAKKSAIENWITQNSKEQKVEIYFPRPRRPEFAVDVKNAPFYGNKNAKVTIVEYSDFQCPFSKQGSKVIKKIKDSYGDRVRIIHKNFPLPFHKFANKMAQAGLCAWDQGNNKFWPFYESLYQNQTMADDKSLVDLAGKSGLKVAQFSKCLKSNKYKQKIDSQIQEANDLGIKSTPTFYVNGKIISGAQKFEVFRDLINEEISLNKNNF